MNKGNQTKANGNLTKKTQMILKNMYREQIFKANQTFRSRTNIKTKKFKENNFHN